jgi:hypothetical protein
LYNFKPEIIVGKPYIEYMEICVKYKINGLSSE